MVTKMPAHCGDDTCSSCIIAGDLIFLAHHGGGQNVNDIVYQTRSTIESMAHTLSIVGATLDDIVQLNFYIKRVFDFRKGADVFREYFKNRAPARMTVVIDFIGPTCLCQMDEIAYKPQQTRRV